MLGKRNNNNSRIVCTDPNIDIIKVQEIPKKWAIILQELIKKGREAYPDI